MFSMRSTDIIIDEIYDTSSRFIFDLGFQYVVIPQFLSI